MNGRTLLLDGEDATRHLGAGLETGHGEHGRGDVGQATVLDADELGGSLGIVLAVLPDVLGGIVDGGRHDGGSRLTGALEQGVDDVRCV